MGGGSAGDFDRVAAAKAERIAQRSNVAPAMREAAATEELVEVMHDIKGTLDRIAVSLNMIANKR